MSEQTSRPRSLRLRAKQGTPSKAVKTPVKSNNSLSKQRSTPKKATPSAKPTVGAKRALSFGVAISQVHGSPGTTRSPGKLAYTIADRHNEISEATGVTNQKVYHRTLK